jgi:hypothetical protein
MPGISSGWKIKYNTRLATGFTLLRSTHECLYFGIQVKPRFYFVPDPLTGCGKLLFIRHVKFRLNRCASAVLDKEQVTLNDAAINPGHDDFICAGVTLDTRKI